MKLNINEYVDVKYEDELVLITDWWDNAQIDLNKDEVIKLSDFLNEVLNEMFGEDL